MVSQSAGIVARAAANLQYSRVGCYLSSLAKLPEHASVDATVGRVLAG
jgi:hypothetical protein